MPEPLILALSCADRPGIVARVTGYLAQMGGNIIEAQQFNDLAEDKFFMRVAFDPGAADREEIREGFGPIAHEYQMAWSMLRRDRPRRVLLMVSKFDHCLADLLYRHRIGEIAMDVVGIVSNHPREAIGTPMIGDIPFHHLPVTKETKAQQEAHQLYMMHVKMVRMAVPKEEELWKKLGLTGKRDTSLTGWLTQVNRFYQNVGQVQEVLAQFNVSPEALQQAQAKVEAVAAMRVDQNRTRSQSQQLREQRDTALHKLEKWVRHFRKIAEIAFEDNPQQLEALGMAVPSGK